MQGDNKTIILSYIELPFGCCDAQISLFEGLIKEFLILIKANGGNRVEGIVIALQIHAVNSQVFMNGADTLDRNVFWEWEERLVSTCKPEHMFNVYSVAGSL